MRILEHYLRDLRDIHATGENVKETSFYPALANLFNGVGAMLNPKVRVVINLRNRGAGLPDGGFFTAKQLQKAGGDEALREPSAFKGQQPERGVLEVKGAKDEVRAIAESEQVRRYLNAYGQVLVTNLREFLLVIKDAGGELCFGESYQLAANVNEFWEQLRNPQAFAALHHAPFSEYLKRVMLTLAPLEDPKDLAWFLASYARDAKARIEHAELPSMQAVRVAMEQALELRFEGERGEAFFRSTLVQTLFYGIFSAWVLWAKSNDAKTKPFHWQGAAYSLHVPVILTLFEQIVMPSNVRGLGLEDLLEWTSETLNRVRREEFFKRFEEQHAVQYFYEPFLEAFDPDLRKQLGVWYTPEEIVRYMVERVDRVLRSELGIENGLADERVYVLDPCCGTGAYLVEVLRRIKQTIDEQGGDALAANDLKRAARERVFGFEILPAPFVVAHLQLGLLLQQQGSPLIGDERVGVYLTNALSGWEPPKEPKKQLAFGFHTLEEERDAAEQVKRDKPILVILGNPPYNAFAGISTTEEGGIVDAYKEGLIKDWGIKKFNLDDLYVRFFRLAERRIAEKTGEGVVCFISNFSYLSDPSFVVMRERFLREFDSLWIDSLNGDSRETGKLTPDGKPDPSIFSTPYNREGIRVGTSIGLFTRKRERNKQTIVHSRELWGIMKRQDLLQSLDAEDFNAQYDITTPTQDNRYSFRLSEVSTEYLEWTKLTELCAEPPSNGLMEKRGGALMDIDRAALESRMRMYFDSKVKYEDIEALETGLTEEAAGYEPQKARKKIIAVEQFDSARLRRYALRPFETRWCYYSPTNPLWNRARPTLWAQCWEGNRFLSSRPAGVANPEGLPLYFTSALGDNDALRGHAYYFPLQLRTQSVKNDQQHSFFTDSEPTTTANLSQRARAYLAALGINDPDADFETAALIWHHALAIGYASDYLEENSDGIRGDFPRIPLPALRELLEQSAALGKQIAALLDTETPVSGVTTGKILSQFKTIAVIRRIDGAGALDTAAGDLQIHAGWGHRGKDNVVMPGKGKITARAYDWNEMTALLPEDAYEYPIVEGDKVELSNYPPPDEMAERIWGKQSFDVHLNDVAVWSNIPERVWNYTIGGYQVIKKWLSYREFDILERGLTSEEAREVTQMARRIAAIILLEDELNRNYESVKERCYAWQK